MREMESGLKECLPPKMKGFITKRQAMLTPDQSVHFQFFMAARRLEADRMVEALTRLDQTDALVEQILGDSKIGAKFHASTCACKPFFCSNNHLALRSPKEPNQFTTRFTLRSRSLKANWIGTLSAWTTMFIPWLTRTGQLWYLFQESDRWTKPEQVRCHPGHKVTARSEKITRFCHRTRLLQTRVVAFWQEDA